MQNKCKTGSGLLSQELKLLFELLKTDQIEDINLNQHTWFIGIDWDHFLELAQHHRVYPLIYFKLKMLEEELVPSKVLQTLYDEYKKNTFKMLHFSKEMEEITKEFTKNGIRILFLKGPILAYELYGDISLRTSKDLDILIPRVDLVKAENILLNLGYVEEENKNIFNENSRRKHHVEYFHPQKRIQIEIHWRLHNPPLKEPTFEDLWERKRNTSLLKYPVYFLGEEDLFLHLIVHGARHGWFRLRWLKDIDQVLKKGVNFKKIDTLLKKYKYHDAVGQAFILTSQILNTSLAEEFRILTLRNRSKKMAKKSVLYISTFKKFKPDIRYLFMLTPNRQKVAYAILLLYPRSWDADTLMLPKFFHFLYFPLRPFLWAWRRMRKALSR
ncbi:MULTISPECIES: nucleotidyltransferase domain-containing protein [Priestia]|uniref:nucleotidyltransferase domain-containing protein n=1 Tax=Priestia sp. FSL P4-0332 TaxID=2921634 RepID=UPI0030F809BB